MTDTQSQREDASEVERRARAIVARGTSIDTDPVAASLEQEIALLLEHLDKLRALEQRLSRSLTRVECYVDTELMQMEERTPKYSPYRFPEREKLQRRLGDIEKERRQLAESQERDERQLQDRLFDAVRKHEVVSG